MDPTNDITTTEVVPPSMEVTRSSSVDRAEIDSQIATAHQYPRNVAAAKRAMEGTATLDADTAASCFYTLPRAGKAITGPSIRMAEIALSTWGNLRASTKIVSVVATGPNPHVEVEAVVHDLETNVAYKVAKRRRITHKKSKALPDEDDINLAANAASAIVLRDAVFKIVPRAIVQPVMEKARSVAAGDAKSLADRRQSVVKRLGVLGVTEARIFSVVDVKTIDEIDLERLSTLIGLGTSIRDGDLTIEEAFPELSASGGEAVSAASTFKEKPATKSSTAKPAEPEKPAASQEPDGPLIGRLVSGGPNNITQFPATADAAAPPTVSASDPATTAAPTAPPAPRKRAARTIQAAPPAPAAPAAPQAPALAPGQPDPTTPQGKVWLLFAENGGSFDDAKAIANASQLPWDDAWTKIADISSELASIFIEERELVVDAIKQMHSQA